MPAQCICDAMCWPVLAAGETPCVGSQRNELCLSCLPRNRYGNSDAGGGAVYGAWGGNVDVDEDVDPDSATGDTQLQWKPRVQRARMFVQDKWDGAGEVVTVRDFMAFFKICLEPIGKLVDTHSLEEIQLNPQQLSVKWTYADKSETRQSAPDAPTNPNVPPERKRNDNGANGDKKVRRTNEELERELPLVTLKLNNTRDMKDLGVQAGAHGEREREERTSRQDHRMSSFLLRTR